MSALHERFPTGIEAVEAGTALLQRMRRAHPTAGLFEAAELQWWWRHPRSTDELPQLFWYDDVDRPAAAVIATDWASGSSALYGDTTIVFAVLPDAAPEWVAHVVDRGLSHLAGAGIAAVELEVDRNDRVQLELLAARGFTRTDDGMVSGWLEAADRPEVGPLHEGYRLLTRDDTAHRPHHYTIRTERHEEERLRQTSLYRRDLDLVVHDADDEVAAYGLFWHDPVSATGVVEPMRTFDDHQRRGLARHVLTAGIDRLAAAGAERISIGWALDNPASDHLYRSVGFEPAHRTDLFAGPTG